MSLVLHAVVAEGLGNSSYLLDLGDGRALAVDVPRDLRGIASEARRHGLRIAYAADTHLHADFLTGVLGLAGRTGAEVLASKAGKREFPHRGMEDGDELDMGGLRIRAVATPGHTDEHLAYEILDGARTVGIFTGGSLLVGSAARTDLAHPERAEKFARLQYRSLQRLARYDDDVAVWPTHGAGSFCAAATDGQRTTTVGAERRSNPLLTAGDEDAFVSLLLGSLGSYPPYFRDLPEVNRRGPVPIEPGSGPPTLSPAQVHAAQAAGAEIIDVRPAAEFGAGHIPGSISIPLRPVFASWLGWLVKREQPFIVVRNADQDPDEVWWQAHNIGYENLRGELADGLRGWIADGYPTNSIPLVTAADVGPRTVLDVRQRAEFADGHIPDAINVELGALSATADAVPDTPSVVMCGHGERAMSAASLLARAGRTDLVVLDGGPQQLADAANRRLVTTAAADTGV